MDRVAKFLNSGLGLLLVGAVVGAIGLFTWQRIDWLSKQEYMRAQVMLDRKLDLVERINADIGALLADADGVIAMINKEVSSEQRDEFIELYNEEQAKWFGVTACHQALLAFYYPHDISEAFAEGLVESIRTLDVRLFLYAKESTTENFEDASKASQEVRRRLQGWNAQAVKCLQSR